MTLGPLLSRRGGHLGDWSGEEGGGGGGEKRSVWWRQKGESRVAGRRDDSKVLLIK